MLTYAVLCVVVERKFHKRDLGTREQYVRFLGSAENTVLDNRKEMTLSYGSLIMKKLCHNRAAGKLL